MGNQYPTLFASILYWTEWKTATHYDSHLSKMQVKFGKAYHPGLLSKIGTNSWVKGMGRIQ